MNKKISVLGLSVLLAGSMLVSCTKSDTPAVTPTPVPVPVPVVGKDFAKAARAEVDRFSAPKATGLQGATLFVRTATNGLPAAGAPINLDSPMQPFITLGYDKAGMKTYYYNFDVQTTTPDEIYAFFKVDGTPVAGQHNVVNTIPGDKDYNDFWVVNKVTVPADYVANSLTNEADILAKTNVATSGYKLEKTTTIVNCPIVPFGSTAARSKTAGVASTLVNCWYKDKAVFYFNFDEAAIKATATAMVPLSPIYVILNKDGDPGSGFMTESTATVPSVQTHNVLATSPADAAYSPLWNVINVLKTNFAAVKDLQTAAGAMGNAPLTPPGVGVNCPVVK